MSEPTQGQQATEGAPPTVAFTDRERLIALFGVVLFLTGFLTAIETPSGKDLVQFSAMLITLVGFNMIRENLMIVIKEVDNLMLCVLCVAGIVLFWGAVNNDQPHTFLQISTVVLMGLWAVLGLFEHFLKPLTEEREARLTAERKEPTGN